MDKFIKDTDEQTGITVNDIIDYLDSNGIKAERKTIYDDIEALTLYGLDIVKEKANRNTYYKLVSRNFEIAELKLLVDAVQSSKFITTKKTNELIKKIEGLASHNDAMKLQRQVYVVNRVKNINEKVYLAIDNIHRAINEDKQITFIYSSWNVKKELVPRRNGELYNVSPWTLIWDDERYYLVAYDEKDKKIKHYRVDKMSKVEFLEEKRNGKVLFENFDVAKYSSKTFGMYGGREENVKLQFENNMIGVVLDRFGSDVMIHPVSDGEHFNVNLSVEVSNQFFGWILGLGNAVRIIEPKAVVDEMKNYLVEIQQMYL
ncbi:MAG: WYL domain-containing protein [Lachnospiraceae bacterium]|nr:WYL domain-containing protein [Lachnospiraceae bacterium]